MKKVIVFLTALISLLLIIMTFFYTNLDYSPAIITIGVFILLFLSYLYFEKGSMGPKEIAVISTLSAFSAAARIMFAPFPNIKPTTFLTALFGYIFGPYEGFIIGATTAFLSNIFLGQGPWTPWQMLAWGIVGALSGFINKKKISTEVFSLLCFVYGIMFDWIMNIWHVLGFIRPLNIKTILLAYATGIVFDILHGVSSFIFSMVFYSSFYKILSRFKRRMKYKYIKIEQNK